MPASLEDAIDVTIADRVVSMSIVQTALPAEPLKGPPVARTKAVKRPKAKAPKDNALTEAPAAGKVRHSTRSKK